MRAEKYWNHDPFFTYVDRWMEGEDIHATARVVLDAAKAAGKDWGEWTLRQDRTSTFMQQMWDKYRRNLPPELGAETSRP
jgi:hypothetical protein